LGLGVEGEPPVWVGPAVLIGPAVLNGPF